MKGVKKARVHPQLLAGACVFVQGGKHRGGRPEYALCLSIGTDTILGGDLHRQELFAGLSC